VLEVVKQAQKAEATVQVNGAKLFAEETCEDLYAAIDGLIDKLDRQVLRHKDRVQSH
jgi:putative sigma-54 modulation protein